LTKGQIPWRRVFVEGVVIVGSILLAFGIDAAWDGRDQRQRRAVLFAALVSDMALARAEVDRVATLHRTGHSAAADLLNFGRVVRSDDDQRLMIDSLVAATCCSTASYDAPLGAVESVVGSGDLDLISDPALVLELTAFPARVADLAWEQTLLQALATELLTYLSLQGIDASLFDFSWSDVPWETGPTSVHELIAAPRFRTLVMDLWHRYNNTTGNLDEIREAITRIESLLPPE
jgi:hypothetical protein